MLMFVREPKHSIMSQFYEMLKSNEAAFLGVTTEQLKGTEAGLKLSAIMMRLRLQVTFSGRRIAHGRN